MEPPRRLRRPCPSVAAQRGPRVARHVASRRIHEICGHVGESKGSGGLGSGGVRAHVCMCCTVQAAEFSETTP